MPLLLGRFRPRLEALEDRTLPAAGLREQFMLELINRMRTNPAAELPLLLNSNDPAVQNALAFFNVNTTLLTQQWATLTPVPPLAYNDSLAAAAVFHSEKMREFDQQEHQLPGEPDLAARVQAFGYTGFSLVGENIFAFAE